MKKKNLLIVMSIIVVFLVAGLYSTGISVAQEKKNNKAPGRDFVVKEGRVEATPISEVTITKTGIQKSINIPPAAFIPDGWYYDFYGTYMNWWYGYGLHGAFGWPCLQAPIIFPKGAKKIDKIYLYYSDETTGDYSVIYVYRANNFVNYYADLLTSHSTWDGWWQMRLLDVEGLPIDPDDMYFISIWAGGSVYLKGVKVIWK